VSTKLSQATTFPSSLPPFLTICSSIPKPGFRL